VTAHFYDLELLTAPGRVFTPRPSTERLVDAALRLIDGRAALVADVGTGAGAIAIALAVHAPQAEIWATDVCARAVELARANAERYGVGDRVHVRQGDLLRPVAGPLDLVVANLPYLPDSQRDLHEYDDEPSEAVYAPDDGLAHYRRLLVDAMWRLRPGGSALVQFRGEVFEGERAHLPALLAQLEAAAPVPIV
jgi:release factor glutamine methyltransferase